MERNNHRTPNICLATLLRSLKRREGKLGDNWYSSQSKGSRAILSTSPERAGRETRGFKSPDRFTHDKAVDRAAVDLATAPTNYALRCVNL